MQVSRLDWTALRDMKPASLPQLVRREGCTSTGAVAEQPAREGWRRFEWPLTCSEPGAVEVDLLMGVLPGHVHIARIADREHVLTETRRTTTVARGYLALGWTHVLGGADHLVFVLVLLLGCATVREAAWAVTGFTAGHSLTLALAVSGRYAADAGTVEAMIGLSIVLVAAENVFRERPTWWMPTLVVGVATAAAWISAPIAWLGVALFAACRFGWLARGGRTLHAALAALFGLLHGLGFAGALSDLAPRDDLWRPLLGFNIGVELGQLMVVLLAWPILKRLRPQGAVPFGSTVAAAAGMFWLVSRLGA